jgi:hypothetical protein
MRIRNPATWYFISVFWYLPFISPEICSKKYTFLPPNGCKTLKSIRNAQILHALAASCVQSRQRFGGALRG